MRHTDLAGTLTTITTLRMPFPRSCFDPVSILRDRSAAVCHTTGAQFPHCNGLHRTASLTSTGRPASRHRQVPLSRSTYGR